MFINRAIIAAAAVATLTVAAPASAVTVLLQNTKATWQNAVGGSAVSYTGSNSSSAQVKWGTPSNDPQSRYKFDVASNNISTDLPPNPSESFRIGTFTHYNEEINSGSSISAVQLKLTTTVFIDGISQGVRDFFFDFTHNETPNVGNNNCCADIVTFSNSTASDVFNVNGLLYTLTFTGFENKYGDPLDSFTSKEGKKNSAKLYAMVSSVPGAVPEPATWLMMIGGFGMIGGALRRQSKVASVLA